MKEDFTLKDGRIVVIKDLKINDFKENNNYDFVHSWLQKVDKYLGKDFKKENLEKDKKEFYEIISNTNHFFIVGAVLNEKIIAFSSLILNSHLKKELHTGRWGITVNPEFQNQGIGAKLLSRIEKLAIEKGLKRLEAEFYDGNKSAEVLYLKKMNYMLEGRRKYAGQLNDGTFVDKILIGKIIDKSLKYDENKRD